MEYEEVEIVGQRIQHIIECNGNFQIILENGVMITHINEPLVVTKEYSHPLTAWATIAGGKDMRLPKSTAGY